MPKYRKIPVVIEAEQYKGDNCKGLCNDTLCPDWAEGVHVHTIHDNQTVFVQNGDYIIPEPDGIHYYPCKADIFEKSYELI